jgi:hypothetical protein
MRLVCALVCAWYARKGGGTDTRMHNKFSFGQNFQDRSASDAIYVVYSAFKRTYS